MGKGITWLLGFCLLFHLLTGSVQAAEVPDTDGDGVADNIDACPADPHKIGPGINGCGISDSNALLVGGWWPGSNSAQPGEMTSLTFYPNGTYVLGQNGDSANPSAIGIEYGSYAINPLTNELTVNVLFDQNGAVGLSNPKGQMTVVAIDTDSFTLDIANGASVNLSRVVDAAKPEVGSWWFGSNDLTSGGITTLTLYPNGTFIFCQNGDDMNPSWVGMEYGTYSIDLNTKILTTSILYDQNGETGLSHPFGQPYFTIEVAGNIAVFNDMGGSAKLLRVTPISPDKIGAYYQGSWYLDINKNGAWDTGSDFFGYFGNAGMTPVAGDWNGDGYTEAGAYVGGTWYLDMNGNGFWDGEPTDQIITTFGGAPDDLPVVGDWNGQGVTEIGVYRQGVTTWYLDYDGNFNYDPAIDIASSFGFAGCLPTVGDWNGNGHAKIGVYSNGQWYLDTNGNFGWDGDGIDNFVPNFGFAGALPVVGDWSGKGVDRLGVYYNGEWYLDIDGDTGWNPAIDKYMGSFGSPGMTPMVGNYFDPNDVIVPAITPVAQAPLTVTGLPSSAYFGQTGITAGANGGSGTGALSFSADASTACSVNSSTGAVTITSGSGTCAISASKAADIHYTATTSVPAAITTITPAAQATLTVTGLPSSASFGQTGITAGTTGGSGIGAVSFNSGTSTACTVNSSTGAVTITSGSGTCAITAAKAADTDYTATTSSAAAITTITRAVQATLTVTGLPSSATYGQTGITAATSGGNGTGAVSFSHGASTACEANPSTGAITIASGSGTCSVIATKAADSNYTAATSAAATITSIFTAAQAPLTVTGLPNSAYYGQTGITAGANGGSGSGALSFSSGASTACSVNSSTGAITITSGSGTCSITVGKLADSNYSIANSAPASITTITPAAQATLTVTGLPSSATYGQTGITAATSGGNGTGGVSFSSGASTACSVNSSTGGVTITSGSGTCSITASKAADSNYTATTSAAASIVTITPAAQATLTVTGLPSSASSGQTGITAGANGGSGTGTLSFSSGASTACSVNFSTGAVTITSGSGTCAITAAKAADTNYTATTSAAASIATITPAAQATLTVTGLPSSATLGQTGITAGTNGGSGTGAISFSSGTSTACTINSSTGAVTISSGSGSCAITAAKAADSNYNSTTSSAALITVSDGGSSTASITVSKTHVDVNDSGSSATFTVVLGSAPTTDDTTIPVSSSNTGEGTVSPASLNFTMANWSTPQIVTVTGVSKTTDAGDKTFTIILGAATSGDANYNLFDPADVSASNLDVVALFSVTPAISAGNYHNLVLANDGTVWGWGSCSSKQLDTGTGTCISNSVPLPKQLNISGKFAAISAGYNYSAIVKKDGTVWTSGTNLYKQLGHATTTTLAQVDGLSNVKIVSAGTNHVLALKNDNTVWAWGKGGAGQLGNGLVANSQIPVAAGGGVAGKTITALASGQDYSLALDNTGVAYAWGTNGSYQLGLGTTANTLTPTAISALTGVSVIGSGQAQTFAVGTTALFGATTHAWGYNLDSQLGTPLNPDTLMAITPTTSPTAVNTFSPALVPSRFDGSNSHAVALVGNTVYAWGDNDDTEESFESWKNLGALGTGDITDATEPVVAFSGNSAMDVNAGADYTLVLLTDGRMQTAGVNDNSQLGSNEVAIGNTNYAAIPVYVEDPGDTGPGSVTSFYAYRPILAGYPAATTTSTTATIAVCPATLVAPANCGPITYYKYSTDSGSNWSAATDIANPINLSGLSAGTVNVWVKGMSDATTELQTNSSAVKVAWTVN